MCPVCTVTVIAGLGLSRALGVDDTVISVWIGGLILSLSFWLLDWADKRKWYQKLSITLKQIITFLIFPIMYILALGPLYLNQSIGIPGNSILGIDKIVAGVLAGSVAFLVGIWADKKERKIRGKQLFQFQKVVFPIVALLIASGLFWIVTL
jgi:hypothetical protein